MRLAESGISELQKAVDTLIVLPNQNLFRVANEQTTFADAFALADRVLYSGVSCITDLMVKEGLINLDFADVRAVMREMGKAMMGTGEATGEKRALRAAEAAIANPLLDDVCMKGARGLLISITGGSDLTLYEVDEAATRIREEVDQDANVIFGATRDDSLEGIVRVSVVATGIEQEFGREAPPALEPRVAEITERLRNDARQRQQELQAAAAQRAARIETPVGHAVLSAPAGSRVLPAAAAGPGVGSAAADAPRREHSSRGSQAGDASRTGDGAGACRRAPPASAGLHPAACRGGHPPAPACRASTSCRFRPSARSSSAGSRSPAAAAREEAGDADGAPRPGRLRPQARGAGLRPAARGSGPGAAARAPAPATAAAAAALRAAAAAARIAGAQEYAKRPAAPPAPRPQQGLDPHGRTDGPAAALEDDHLEIPAFLRRQSN